MCFSDTEKDVRCVIINVLNHKFDKLSFKPLQLKFLLEITILAWVY